jgi:hypothetical protein
MDMDGQVPNFKAGYRPCKDGAAHWGARKEMAPQRLEKIDSATENGALEGRGQLRFTA